MMRRLWTRRRQFASDVAAARSLLHLGDADLPPRGARVCVAMSGGVDSAVVAWTLKQAAYRVSAVHMKNWEASEEDNVPTCTQEADYAHVRQLAQRIGIDDIEQVSGCICQPIDMCQTLKVSCEKVNFTSEYWLDVFEPLLAGLRQLTTPNPDVLCNRVRDIANVDIVVCVIDSFEFFFFFL
jgi:tRNA U34 2-thiouridine synthase MnmA/TrmU